MKMPATTKTKPRTKQTVTPQMLRELRVQVTRAWKGKVTATQEIRHQRTKAYDR